jgi:tetratricopeptide (TPR) repeat protein
MRSVLALVLLGLAVTTTAAQPDRRDKAAGDAAFAEGQQRYARGEYLEAAIQFELAYARDPDPAYLFNIAQAYRFGKACKKAGAYYRKFLDAVSKAPNLAKVRQYIEESDACAAEQELATAGTTPTPMPDPEPDRSPPWSPPEKPTPPTHGRELRWAGIGAIAAGAFGIGAGIYFVHRVGVYEDRYDAACTPTEPCDLGAETGPGGRLALADAGGKRAARWATVAFALGGLAIAGGGALYIIGDHDEQQPSLVVIPTADGALAVGGVRF